MHQDAQHLKLLSIFHYVLAVLALVLGTFPVGHFLLGATMVFSPRSLGGTPPPPLLGWFFMLIAGAIMLFFWALAVLLVLAGWFLHRRRSYRFCFVVACVALLYQPFGTVLGAFTLIVLLRPSVKELFRAGAPAPDEEDGPGAVYGARLPSGSYNITGER